MIDPDIQRTLSEVLTIAVVDSGAKSVFVEGWDDKLFVDDYLEEIRRYDIGVYHIDQVQFPLDAPQSKKDRVILLARELQALDIPHPIQWLCIVDVDMDQVLNIIIEDLIYLVYTDYNSMELYLLTENNVRKLLRNVCRITKKIDINAFLASITSVCRSLFMMHCVFHTVNQGLIDYDKNLSLNKEGFILRFSFNDYWNKAIIAKNLHASEPVLRSKYDSLMLAPLTDSRKVIRGHDLVHCLYYCVKKTKGTSFRMSEDDFAHSFWVCVDYRDLHNEMLFRRIRAL